VCAEAVRGCRWPGDAPKAVPLKTGGPGFGRKQGRRRGHIVWSLTCSTTETSDSESD
jgi:hypothetical protein